jgi:3-phenylpropionate/trans-cinnamate dioxygenase ferredoxin reductase subunit
MDVTVLEMADRVMGRVVCTELSSFYHAEHTRRGVRIHCNARVHDFMALEGRVTAVVCEDAEYPADIVLIGIGAVAADELALAAGLECAGGIVVDENCRTSDSHIYAAGDCTSHPSVRYACTVRLESVDNAFEQGTVAALSAISIPAAHDKVPWFWSDQYDLKLVIVGLSRGYDRAVIRGDPAQRVFSVCYLRDGELIAVDTVNNPRDQMAARKLVAARVSPRLERIADLQIPLRECV